MGVEADSCSLETAYSFCLAQALITNFICYCAQDNAYSDLGQWGTLPDNVDITLGQSWIPKWYGPGYPTNGEWKRGSCILMEMLRDPELPKV